MKQEAPMDLWVYEREAFDAGIKLVCGVDEAGRGPLAGPVCAAAVILPPGLEIPGLNDSKKLTDKKRRELYDIMIEQAVSYGIAFASEQEIDEINILQATFLAMERAMQKLSPQPELALWQVMPWQRVDRDAGQTNRKGLTANPGHGSRNTAGQMPKAANFGEWPARV